MTARPNLTPEERATRHRVISESISFRDASAALARLGDVIDHENLRRWCQKSTKQPATLSLKPRAEDVAEARSEAITIARAVNEFWRSKGRDARARAARVNGAWGVKSNLVNGYPEGVA